MFLKPGTRLGPYEVRAPIEAGGMGSVYRGIDTRLSRAVAIKVLPIGLMQDERKVRRFMREARAAASLTHPNIVAIHDVGEAEIAVTGPLGESKVPLRYLVEELVDGVSLRRLLRSGRPAQKKLVDLAIGVAQGLVAAHEKGLIHRDLKPENILVDLRGSAKIADFGLVRWIYPDTSAPGGEDEARDESLTRTGYIVGTLGYMSPEQVKGDELTPASDLFVFGIVLYELLAGRTPFGRENAEDAFRAILREAPEPLSSAAPNASPRLVHIVEKCLQKKVEDRYPNAQRLLESLQALKRELSSETPLSHSSSVTVPNVGSGAGRRAASGIPGAEVPPLFWLVAALATVLAFGSGFVVGRATGRVAPAAPSR